jgi:hypothetical protein
VVFGVDCLYVFERLEERCMFSILEHLNRPKLDVSSYRDEEWNSIDEYNVSTHDYVPMSVHDLTWDPMVLGWNV